LQQLEYEAPKEIALIPKDRESTSNHLAILYLKYIQIFRKLEVGFYNQDQPLNDLIERI
jgi:hypothetical protein